MNSETNIIQSPKDSHLIRLGGILTNIFHYHDITVDYDNYEIEITDVPYSVKVRIFDDGHLEWVEFNDSDIVRSKKAYESGEKFFLPKIEKIENLYYSPEYEGIIESAGFKIRLDKGRYTFKSQFIKALSLALIWIATIIGLSYIPLDYDLIRILVLLVLFIGTYWAWEKIDRF